MLSGNICYFNTLSNTFVEADKANDKATDKKAFVFSEVGLKEPARGATRDSHRVHYNANTQTHTHTHTRTMTHTHTQREREK